MQPPGNIMYLSPRLKLTAIVRPKCIYEVTIAVIDAFGKLVLIIAGSN